jgi:hypothetical protein
MACFSLAWLESLLIWIVILLFVVAVVNLIIPAILSAFGPAPPGASVVLTVLRYLVWTLVAIAVIIFIFDLIACALGGGSGISNLGFPLRR